MVSIILFPFKKSYKVFLTNESLPIHFLHSDSVGLLGLDPPESFATTNGKAAAGANPGVRTGKRMATGEVVDKEYCQVL